MSSEDTITEWPYSTVHEGYFLSGTCLTCGMDAELLSRYTSDAWQHTAKSDLEMNVDPHIVALSKIHPIIFIRDVNHPKWRKEKPILPDRFILQDLVKKCASTLRDPKYRPLWKLVDRLHGVESVKPKTIALNVTEEELQWICVGLMSYRDQLTNVARFGNMIFMDEATLVNGAVEKFSKQAVKFRE